MGAARNHENPDAGHGYVPKLTLAGRLTATWDGRPVVIDADESGVRLTVPAVRTAWAARRLAGSFVPAFRTLRRFGVPVRLHVAGIFTLDLLPKPSALARRVIPGLSGLD
jgi:hypothetical protein